MTPSTPEAGKQLSFEEMLAELESVVHDLEAGDISLEQALARYERGVALLKQCYGQLQSAEQKIFLLNGEGPDGKPLMQPFDHVSADPRRRTNKAESQ
jgi:exodeoxyribonuclease VII small subunit